MGKGLRAAGHRVQLTTLDTFEPMVRDAGLEFARFEEIPLSFLDRVIASDGGWLRRATGTRRILSAMMERLLDDASRAVQDAEQNIAARPGRGRRSHTRA